MTTTLNEHLIETIQSLTYEQLSTSFGAVIVFLLIILLIASTVVSAQDAKPSLRWFRISSGVLIPLLVNIAIILGLRLLQLINI